MTLPGAVTNGRFRFAPILTATVLTVLGLWLFKTVVQVFVLLFLGILISLYLSAVAEWIERRMRIPQNPAFALAVVSSLGALVLLGWILVPPVVTQTQALIEALPGFIASWEDGLDNLAVRFPFLKDAIGTGDNRIISAVYHRVSSMFGDVVPRVFSLVHMFIDVFAVGIMGIYLALHPALYREWLIALFPPIHRDLVRDVIGDLANTLRSYIVGQLTAMGVLALLTAVGLYLLDVPFWLPFGIFTGLVAVVPFFGTLVSTALPAFFVLAGPGFAGLSGWGHAWLVVLLGVVIHVFEGNVVAPLVMSKKVDLPPVLTIMSVLVMGKILGPLGLVVAVPTLASIMVIVRRILITRIYEGQGFRRTARERPLLLRLPVPGGGVLIPLGPPIDVVSIAERQGATGAGT